MSVVGLLLVAVAGCLLLAELAAPGIGVAGVAAAVSLVLGVAVLAGDAPGPALGPAVAAPVLVAGAVALAIVARRVLRSQRELPLSSGLGQLLDQEATVRLDPSGVAQGFVAGAWWALRPAAGARALADGERRCGPSPGGGSGPPQPSSP